MDIEQQELINITADLDKILDKLTAYKERIAQARKEVLGE